MPPKEPKAPRSEITTYQPSWIQNKSPPPRNTISLFLEEPKPKFGRRNALNI